MKLIVNCKLVLVFLLTIGTLLSSMVFAQDFSVEGNGNDNSAFDGSDANGEAYDSAEVDLNTNNNSANLDASEVGPFEGEEFTDPMFRDPEVFTAMTYGERASNLMVNSDTNVVNGSNAIFFGTQPLMGMEPEELGYTHRNMPGFLSGMVIANASVSQLFRRHLALRSVSNVTLPAEFNALVSYIFGYIRNNAFATAAADNGITHLQLARQIVRASFCFGNDPLMVASKIRRETSFSRKGVSSGGAVGFSQMTGAGIREVQHQMSGDSEISASNARTSFRNAIRCFIGRSEYTYAVGTRETVQTHLQNNYILDLIFGQILTKAYVSFASATGIENATEAYRRAFTMYNGDQTVIRGTCLQGRVQTKDDYACDVIAHFNRMSAGWNQSVQANTRSRASYSIRTNIDKTKLAVTQPKSSISI